MRELTPEEDYVAVGPLIDAAFSGVCTINENHRIKRKDIVTRVERADNPFLAVSGVACANCTKILKKGNVRR